MDEIPTIKGVEAFRLNFTLETPAEVKRIIKMAQGKLNGSWTDLVFDSKTDTRGHYNKEII
jgi:putative protease